MEVLPIAEIQVAYFAAALESGGLILLLSKSTDKLFQPEMSAIIQQKAWGAGARLRRRRYLMVGGCCAAFMATMIIFGRAVLRLYGDEFQNGYPALCFVAFGCCMWTLFSLAPAFLLNNGRHFRLKQLVC